MDVVLRSTYNIHNDAGEQEALLVLVWALLEMMLVSRRFFLQVHISSPCLRFLVVDVSVHASVSLSMPHQNS